LDSRPCVAPNGSRCQCSTVSDKNRAERQADGCFDRWRQLVQRRPLDRFRVQAADETDQNIVAAFDTGAKGCLVSQRLGGEAPVSQAAHRFDWRGRNMEATTTHRAPNRGTTRSRIQTRPTEQRSAYKLTLARCQVGTTFASPSVHLALPCLAFLFSSFPFFRGFDSRLVFLVRSRLLSSPCLALSAKRYLIPCRSWHGKSIDVIHSHLSGHDTLSRTIPTSLLPSLHALHRFFTTHNHIVKQNNAFVCL